VRAERAGGDGVGPDVTWSSRVPSVLEAGGAGRGRVRPARLPRWVGGAGSGAGCRPYDPDVEPEELEGGAGEALPAGGVPWPVEPDPMLGQFLVELDEPDPDEPELGLPELELPEPELVLPELEVPVLPVLELLLDEGVLVEEPEPEELVFGVELDVVAAPATNAPPTTRPVVNAPTASTLRKLSCMDWIPFVSVRRPPFGGCPTACDPDLWTGAERPRSAGGVALRIGDDSQELRTLGCGRVASVEFHVGPTCVVARQQYERMGTSRRSPSANSMFSSR
jgi:hypothetical protein